MLTRDPSAGRGQPDHPPLADRARRRRDRLWRPMARPGSSAATRSRRRWCSSADQVLVGLNRTRRLYNQRIRTLRGMSETLPVAGDKLVCLRNDRTKGLINGGLWRVEELGGMRKDFVRMTVRSEDEPGRAAAKVAVLKAFFEGDGRRPALSRTPGIRRIRLRLRAHRAQGAGLAMGRTHAVRREPRLPRTPRALALYRRHPRGQAHSRSCAELFRTDQVARVQREAEHGEREDRDQRP